MVMKFNPKTNRFEKVGATSTTTTTVPTESGGTGSTYESRRNRSARQRQQRQGATPARSTSPTSTTMPKSPTTTVPKTPTTTVPASPTTTVPEVTPEQQKIIDDAMNGVVSDPVALANAYIALYGTDSSTTDAVTKARIAANAKTEAARITAKAQKEAAQKAAKIYRQSGADTQSAYNTLAESQFADTQKRAKEYYGGQRATALGNIDRATADFLKNLIAPSAYANAPVAELTPAQQGLMANLQAYGATGGQAAQQMAQDTASNQFLADLMRGSTKQLQTADTDYFNALSNAAVGGQAASRQGLESILSGLEGQTTAQAEAIRRQLLEKGLEALLSGQQNAANVIAGAQ